MSVPTKRASRIEAPSISLAFRLPDGTIETQDLYREDILEWAPAEAMPAQFYLVLDFGTEERFARVETDGSETYEPTGRVMLSLQPVEYDPGTWNLETAIGLGPEVNRFADQGTDDIGDRPGEEPATGRPLVGWTRHPVSSRR